jgi:hypothetical protein
MTRALFRLALLALALRLVSGGVASAHQSTVVYCDLSVEGRTVKASLQIRNSDLFAPLGISEERPYPPTVAEAMGQKEKLSEYVRSRVTVKNGAAACPGQLKEIYAAEDPGGFFLMMKLEYACADALADPIARYELFFDIDPQHQGFARVMSAGDALKEFVFRAGDRELHLLGKTTRWQIFTQFVGLGLEHIFTGYDHLSFLFGLLVVAIALGLRGGLRYVIGIVTAFTVAHSITLIAAGLGWVRISPRIVEPAIALSIAYVAVENLLVKQPRFRWLLTFGFGLVHGFGFASVLGQIGLPRDGLILSLLSFNVGVELGQLAVVTASAPLLLVLVPRLKRGEWVRKWGSVVLLCLATLWFFERVLERRMFGGWLG